MSAYQEWKLPATEAEQTGFSSQDLALNEQVSSDIIMISEINIGMWNT